MCLGTLTALLLLGSEAVGQEIFLGETGHVVVSAERLFGYLHSETTQNQNGVTTTASSNDLSLLGSPLGGALTGYAWPRLGLDVFVGRHFSIGGSFSYFHGSANLTTGDADVFQIAPRIGAASMFGQRFGIFPRLGVTIDYISSGPMSESLFSLSADFPLLLVIAPRIALTLGPIADVSLGGTAKDKTSGASIATKLSDVGVEAGFLLFF